jgi:hypothetical protein
MKLGRLIALALIAPLLAVPVSSGMLVLCFGSDGHVAVESANASLCCREWDTAHRGAPDNLLETLESASSPCCNDVGLSFDSATLSVLPQKVIPRSPVPCCIPFLASPLRTVSAGTFPLSTESPVAASLRTVVLLA